jgi:hypothetical protein
MKTKWIEKSGKSLESSFEICVIKRACGSFLKHSVEEFDRQGLQP